MDQSPLPVQASGRLLLGWNATSIPLHQRGRRWYAVGSGLLLAGIIYGILSGAWSLSIVLVLCGSMYFLLRNHVPQEKTIAFLEDGVRFENDFWKWDDVESFWIIQTPGYNELHVSPKSRRRSDIVIQMPGIDPLLVRELLSKFTQENAEKKETLVDMIIRICKL